MMQQAPPPRRLEITWAIVAVALGLLAATQTCEAGCPLAGKKGGYANNEPIPRGHHSSHQSDRKLVEGGPIVVEEEEDLELDDDHKAKPKYCHNARRYELSEVDPARFDWEGLYLDYATLFDWGWKNQMGEPMQKISSTAPVSQNRLANFCIRQAFHDSASVVDSYVMEDEEMAAFYGRNFGAIIDDLIDPAQDGYHIFNMDKVAKYGFIDNQDGVLMMKSSAADGSTLISDWERLHPNQNYDQHASRIVYAFHAKVLMPRDENTCSWNNNQYRQDVEEDSSKYVSLMDKYSMSYADALHNCAMAATKWTVHGAFDTATSEYMSFGRRDACYYDNDVENKDDCSQYGCGEPIVLTGPTFELPGAWFHGTEFFTWFHRRGMNVDLALGLMASHDLLDDTYHLDNSPYDIIDLSNKYFVHLSTGSHELREDQTMSSEPVSRHLRTKSRALEAKPEDFFHESFAGCGWSPYGNHKEWPYTHNDCAMGVDALANEFEERYDGTGMFETSFLGEMAKEINVFASSRETMFSYFRGAMLILTGHLVPESESQFEVVNETSQFGSYAPLSTFVHYFTPYECREYFCDESCERPMWGQYMGVGYGVPSCCATGSSPAVPQNKYYGQCLKTSRRCKKALRSQKGWQDASAQNMPDVGPLLKWFGVSVPECSAREEILEMTHNAINPHLKDFALGSDGIADYHPHSGHGFEKEVEVGAGGQLGL